MKKFSLKKVKKWIREHPQTIAIAILSIIAVLVGRLAIGWMKAILIVGTVDLLLCIPAIYRKITGKKKRKLTKSEKKKRWKYFWIGIFSLCIIGLIAVCMFFYMIVKNAPEFDPDLLYQKESTIIYDTDGTIYAKLGTEKRENISYEQLPEVLVDAIVATEDSRFFQHNGFDLPRFLVASFKQLLGNSNAGGASTLTMQVVKNTYTSTTSQGWEGIVRKFTDIYMAIFKVEKKYTKKEIIEFYVNSNYLGGGAYGVEQASLTYFGKSAKDLNLAEAAMIAGLFNAPTYLDPYVNPEGAEARRQTVLYLMERHGYITSEERAIASKLTVEDLLVEHEETTTYQGFIDTVVEEVKDRLGVDPYTTPLEIYSTMDMEKQAYLDNIMSGNTWTWENDAVQAGIMVLDVDTGAIVAVGANRTGKKLQYNYATMTKRQIGSTAKPLYDYGPGIEYNNWSTYTPFTDEPHAYSDGTVIQNWNRNYEGFRTMREALRVSRNIPALKAFQSVKNSDIKTFVTNLGLSPELEGNIVHEAHALGGYNGESPLSMAAAYSAFANGGYYNEPYSVSKVVYRDTGEVWEYKGQKKRAMSEETAYMVADMLIDSGQYGLSRWSNINGAQYGAKSGTSNYDAAKIQDMGYPSNAVNDLWITGINAEYAISLWYGYKEAIPEYTSTTNTTAHRRLFQQVAKGFWEAGVTFTKPDGVVEVEIETETYPAQLASENTPEDKKITELFKKGTEPTETSKRFAAPDDVKAVDATFENGVMTLSWDAVATPWGLDQVNAESLGNSLFGDETERNKFINSYMSYNRSVLGEVGYNVYRKHSDGSLELLGFTKDTTFEHNITSTSESITYVVKATYTILKAESSGSETTYRFSETDAIITGELNGSKTINFTIGDPAYEDPGVTVLDNLIDVTDKATIEETIVRKSDNKEVEEIDFTKVDTYTITYKVTYKTYTESFVRTIIIKEPSV